MQLNGIAKLQKDLADKNDSLHGKAVILRVDFNVPLTPEREISDDNRIQAALPTIRFLQEQGAKIILLSHLGRPKGTKNPKYSLEPVAAKLVEILEQPIYFYDTLEEPSSLAKDLKNGEIALLENLRFHEGEENNSKEFAENLALCGDIYINEAFGLIHRQNASNHALAKIFAQKGLAYAGFLIESESIALQKILDSKVNAVAVLGGAKVADKIIMIENLSRRCSDIIIGGAMGYTFLTAKGLNVGASRIEKDKISVAKDIIALCQKRGVRLHLPEDHLIVEKFEADADFTTSEDGNIPEGWMGLDIGPKTQEHYYNLIQSAACVFWNGPMGVFEWDNFAGGTKKVAQALQNSEGYTVVGGGDSAAAVVQFEQTEGISHISTGGGATLAFIEGGDLPGLEFISENTGISK